MNMRMVLLSFFLIASLGCSPEFARYNVVTDLRILALSADKPDVFDGETAVFSALVTDDNASYEWSWCPLPAGSADAFECQLNDAQLEALLAGALGPDAFDVPDLILGTTPTVSFLNEMSPEVGRRLCDSLVQFLPEGASVPQCLEDYFRYTIKLKVTSEDGSKTVVGVRWLNVILNPDVVVNTNPEFTEVEIGLLNDASQNTNLVLSDGTTPIVRPESYRLVANAEANQSQEYFETNRGAEPSATSEDLVLSWFSEVGEIDRIRTSFLEGERPLEQLNNNEWVLTEEDATGSTRLWMVMRDERGGTSWQMRTLMVGGAQ